MVATIEPTEIHCFIHEHDSHALEDKQNSLPLFLETLGIQEFCGIVFLACMEEITVVIDRLKVMAGELAGILDQDDKEMTIAYENGRLIAFVLKRTPIQGTTQAPTHSTTRPSQLHKNPMFRTSFFKKECLQVIDIQRGGKCGDTSSVTRGSKGTLSFVPMLPPCKCELDLASNDGQVWAISNSNLLAPFSMEMLRMLASITNEEIEECKQRVLLANTPTKRILAQTWDMYLFSAGKYDCEEKVIVCTKMDIEIGLTRDKNHHGKLWNWHVPFFKCDYVLSPTKKNFATRR